MTCSLNDKIAQEKGLKFTKPTNEYLLQLHSDTDVMRL